MAVISLKCSDQEKESFQDYCEKKGVSVSSELRRLMNDSSGNEPDKIGISTLHERLKSLEAKFASFQSSGVHIEDSTPYKPKKKVDPGELGDLITIKEIAELTGYSTSTLGSKLSREGIQAVERIDGNRGGLYSKNEILDKIGVK